MNKISIIIPAFNEEETIVKVLENVVHSPLPGTIDKQLIVVDDNSSDKTNLLTSEFIRANPHMTIDLINIPENRGKGYAIRRALGMVKGDIILVQDADMEYDPSDFPQLLEPILRSEVDVVYGSRFLTGNPYRSKFNKMYLANRLLTYLSNLFTEFRLTDMETGYKVFRTSILQNIHLYEDRFGFEAEITAKVNKMGFRIHEVPVSYVYRSYKQGKKIKLRDGIDAVLCILKYNLQRS